MSNKISWTDQTWNPVTGCSKISPGCRNCYAERMSKRLAGRAGYPPAPDNFKVTLHPERLEQPLRWRKPRRVFVCSMGDLFHIRVTQNFIEDIFRVIAQCPQHVFQILTKRADRMKEYAEYLPHHLRASGLNTRLDNVWWGVTAENQKAANERIPLLLQIPAAVRFVSCEPLLGPVNLSAYLTACPDCGGSGYVGDEFCGCNGTWNTQLDWVIAGGETGPGARPMHPDWARGLRDQCQAAGVAFHFKQHGQFLHTSQMIPGIHYSENEPAPTGDYFVKCNGGAAGHLLDGVEWRQMPGAVK